MNNLTFGNEAIGYYETIAGGAGAGKHKSNFVLKTTKTSSKLQNKTKNFF